jgi:hypothetical protein
MEHQEELDLQSQLILGTSGAGAGAAAATLPTEQPKAERVQRRTTSPSRIEKQIDKGMNALAYLGIIGIAGLLWWWGAGFTVSFLSGLTSSIKTWGWPAWGIPVFVTMIELKLWRHMTNPFSPAGAAVGVVLLFDIGTSFAGFIAWAAGRTLPLFTGITFPSAGWPLWIIGIGLGVVFAFLPERLARWALAEFVALRKK